MPRELISQLCREILTMKFHREISSPNFRNRISQQNFATEFCLKIPPQTEKAQNFISEIPRGILIRGFEGGIPLKL
ncbi:hypothetical protein [uncultured Campylobacter sp.]|uniref:hypothetical protein n=1 Tax=uncultured Campylobacter sp. TaxID=218934 RepID=UPI002636101B|nr:hypothetical protein [uncultured Campylobacter sp.]